MRLVQDQFRAHDGLSHVAAILETGPGSSATHRAMLVLRVLSDREADRIGMLNGNCLPPLVRFIAVHSHSEVSPT